MTKSGKTFVWAVGWIVYIAGLLIMAAFAGCDILSTAPEYWVSYTSVSAKPCPPEGDDPKPDLQALDRLKNRIALTTINPRVTLEAMLTPGDDRGRFNESQSASITGYVLKVKDGGPESCECHNKSEAMKDIHIVIGRKGDPPLKGVVVEVTRYMKALHPDWTTANLRKQFLGKQVTVTGPLLFDHIHVPISFTDNPKGKHNVRWTPWEVHPVISISLAVPQH